MADLFLKPDLLLKMLGDASSSVVVLNQNRELVDGQPTLYRCRDFACEQPLVGEALETWLS